MKNLVLFTFAFTLMFSVNAQLETPQPSPFSKVEQKVGLTDVTLEYSRPSMRGRAIFGDLVPYGKLWRAGANKNSIITFSTDAVINGTALKAGSYAIFVTPHERSWEIAFYSNTENWGAPKELDRSKIAANIKVETMKAPMKVETFTMTFDNLTNSSAELAFLWEDTMASVKFELPTDKLTMVSIEKALKGNPTANDYYAAAVYNISEGKDLKRAQEWMDKAIDMMDDPAFYQLRQQSLLYAQLGDKKKASEIAKISLKKSKEAGNEDYVKMNEDSLKEWAGN